MIFGYFDGENILKSSSTRLGFFAATAVVLLRVTLGWHFFCEGMNKLAARPSFSGPFFSSAKGPFADFFHGMVWDKDGLARLDENLAETTWRSFVDRAAYRLGFDDKQKKRAEDLVTERLRQLKQEIEDKEDDIYEYKKGLERRDKNSVTEERSLDSFKTHDARIASELAPKRGSWQASIDKIWKGLEQDVNGLAAGSSGGAWVEVGKPGQRFGDSETSDFVIPYFHTAIGICLIFGLFTRLAAFGALAFLVSVVAAYWPGTVGNPPSFYQQVESVVAFVLIALDAGRYAGLDFLIRGYMSTCCAPKVNTP